MGEARHAGKKYAAAKRAQPIKHRPSPKPFQPQRNGCMMGCARLGLGILCRFSRASPILRLKRGVFVKH